MEIVEASTENLNEWVRMGLLLWPNHSEDDLRKEFEESLRSGDEKTFLYRDNGIYLGFQTVGLRREYIPGAKHKPVGYLEGIYVDKEYRNKGIARKLVEAAEDWAKEKGCKEMASDTWDWNDESAKFHGKLGFKKVDTLIHFIKDL